MIALIIAFIALLLVLFLAPKEKKKGTSDISDEKPSIPEEPKQTQPDNWGNLFLICETCHGKGKLKYKGKSYKCPNCNGSGHIM